MLDTNVLASGSIASAGTIAQIIDAWRDGQFQVICSQALYLELSRTLLKPYFAGRLSPQAMYDYLDLVRSTATFVVPTRIPHGIAPDPEDDLILAAALDGGADYLATGDRAFRAIVAYAPVQVVKPAEFLTILNAHWNNPAP